MHTHALFLLFKLFAAVKSLQYYLGVNAYV